MRAVHIRSVALGAGAFLLLALTATPAGAATVSAKKMKSYAAGYATTSPAVVTSVDATITLPTFTCTNKSDLLGADIGVYDPTDDAYSFVTTVLACTKKKAPLFLAQLDVDSSYTYPDVTMNPGDTVTMSISCSATTGTSIAIDDVTSDTSGTASSATPNTCASSFIGDEGFEKGKGNTADPLPTFGAVDYSNVTVNTDPLGSVGTISGNYFGGKKDVIETGLLTDGGTAFTTTQGG
jgi:hypothetical protein